ncbi:MAG: DUF6272 family protein [Flavobacteriales bacterium]|jgi:hypothetical protein|nr:DUF6272 family protein [Flavobacteriales bacterium]MCB0759098.1 hypothetical protein [Flavobacteriales bacterium]
MDHAIPLPEMGHRWLDRTRSRFLADPSAILIFEHSGSVHPETVPEFLELAEQHSHAHGDPVLVRKRLMHVLVEAVDNLSRHALGILNDASFALLVRDRSGYRLATGNAVPYATGMLLSHRVEVLNLMGQEDLKEHYLKVLAGNARSSNGGAGLGLLTLARKSAGPLVTSSDPLGPFTSYFTFEMRVGGKNEDPDRPAA